MSRTAPTGADETAETGRGLPGRRRHPCPNKKKTSLKKKYLYGYDAHRIVTRDTEHDAVLLDDGTPNPDVLPALVLDKPGQRPAYNGLKILNRLERSLAWMMHARRHARNYEGLIQHSHARALRPVRCRSS
ncbi:hypothetical protein ACFY1U_49000 [Streptomyces sp. NPDC001351]|uniref:hypothetical protein n=1 Tax=Streptomyces sp. NPDC001351 TaxID=3364564 RepID=UPI0036BA8C1A